MSQEKPDIDRRLDALEERLSRIEALLSDQPADESDDLEFTFEVVETEAAGQRPPAAHRFVTRRRAATRQTPHAASFTVTQILGWGGVAALVLAAAYLIKLGIDLGWLTPARQVMLAVLGGGLLVGAGILLRRADRQYAGLLPAGGVAILFMATYGAHLYYRLIPYGSALTAVVLVCLLSLWLCRHFESELYALFAVAGSYSAPLLLDGLRTGVNELALYYTAWSLLFSLFAVWFGRRGIYLLAAYMALIGFDLVWYLQWHRAPYPPWPAALLFQSLQGVIFAVAATLFSVQRRTPLDRNAAWAHLPPLLLFYALEYALLSRYLPQWAPWIAVASTGVVAGLYLLARRSLQHDVPGGGLLLAVYTAVVLFHAGYLEAIPASWQPWAGLAAGGLVLVWVATGHVRWGSSGFVLAALGLIFFLNLLRAMENFDLDRVAGGSWLSLVYAVELYAGYVMARRADLSRLAEGALALTGHLATMAAAVHLLDHRLAISLAWCLLAVSCLGLAIYFSDRLLGQSSLLVFAAAAIKVLLFDLAGAAPLIRVVCLLVLGVSCYLGGWLYRKMGAMDKTPDATGDPS